MNSEINIGKKIKTYRTLLECNQDEFAYTLLISRISQSNIERTKLLSDISDDLLFRLYYLTSKEKANEEEYITGLRQDLLSLIEKEINSRQHDKKNVITKKKTLTNNDKVLS